MAFRNHFSSEQTGGLGIGHNQWWGHSPSLQGLLVESLADLWYQLVE